MISSRTILNCTATRSFAANNYRFVGATDNIRKSAEKPGEFFGRLKAKGVNIENHLLLSEFASDPIKLKFDVATYEDFRDRRLKAIFDIADKVVNAEKHR